MPRNTSIFLDHQCERFIEAQIASGKFGSASEVIHAALQLFEEHERQVATLRQVLLGDEAADAPRDLKLDELNEPRQARG